MAEWRKAGETINDGERRVLKALRDGLPDSWIVISNLYLRLTSATVLEIDAVVVGRDGIWLLETKDWGGKITGDALHWRLSDGSLRDSPPASIERKAKALHSVLVNIKPVYRGISKVGFVVIANGGARLKLSADEKKVVFLLDEIVPALKSGEHVFGKMAVKLDRENIQQVANELFQARVSPPPRRAGHYVLEEEIGKTDTYSEHRARHLFLPSRCVRIKRFEMTDELVPRSEREEQLRLFLRDMEALAELESGKHSAIPIVYDFFADEDSDAVFWMAEEWLGGQTLRQVMDSKSTPASSHLRTIRGLCEALACCHRRGIIHRNLTPDNVVVQEDGTIRLINFDFSRIEGKLSISPRKKLCPGEYTAPEQIGSASGVDARADLFALGVLWTEMLTGKPARAGSQLEASGSIPENALRLLGKLLAKETINRPKTADDVLDYLKEMT